MKTPLCSIALSSLFLMTTACVIPSVNGGWDLDEDDEPKELPTLEAVYVSGHLGNYMDCPQDAYSEQGDEARRGAPANDADFGACEPTEDGEESNCGYILNCEAAQLTIQIANTGLAGADGVSIESIAILDENGQVAATLPLINAIDAETGLVFDGELDADETITLRLDYQGPRDISEFVPSQNRWSGSAILQITVGADNHDDVLVETKAVEVLPAIVT